MPLPMTNQPAARSFLKDRAYEALFDAIQSGQLEPGEALRDEALMDWLGMSRTPIRHALLRLSESGLIDMSAGRTTTVAPLRPERTNRALFVSGICNEYAIRHAIAMADEALDTELTRRVAALESAADGGDSLTLARAVNDFFATLAHAAGNTVLLDQFNRLAAELARFLLPGAAAGDAFNISAVRTGAEQVRLAVTARDVDAAVAAVQQMYEQTRENFLQHFREPIST